MKKQKRIFIAGTDTDVGKTLVTCCLTEKLQQQGYSVVAVKPVAAGCDRINGRLVNEDAQSLIQVMDQNLKYETVNPVTLKEAIAPHIAAEKEGIKLSVESIQTKCQLSQHKTDFILVEGAGGWLVPLNDTETLADFVSAEKLDVVLVVGMKLGCINHALLTCQSIKASGLKVVGWIANSTAQEMPFLKENIETLKKCINAPFLGEIPYIQSDNPNQKASVYVNIAPLE